MSREDAVLTINQNNRLEVMADVFDLQANRIASYFRYYEQPSKMECYIQYLGLATSIGMDLTYVSKKGFNIFYIRCLEAFDSKMMKQPQYDRNLRWKDCNNSIWNWSQGFIADWNKIMDLIKEDTRYDPAWIAEYQKNSMQSHDISYFKINEQHIFYPPKSTADNQSFHEFFSHLESYFRHFETSNQSLFFSKKDNKTEIDVSMLISSNKNRFNIFCVRYQETLEKHPNLQASIIQSDPLVTASDVFELLKQDERYDADWISLYKEASEVNDYFIVFSQDLNNVINEMSELERIKQEIKQIENYMNDNE